MEPSKRFVIATAKVQELEKRDLEIQEKIIEQRAVAHQIRMANAQRIVDGDPVDSGKLIEANSRLNELEGALELIRDRQLPAAKKELDEAGHEEATREVRELNQLNESEYNVLVRDSLAFIERLRVIDRRQARKLELQSAYRGLGGESILGDMSAASAAGAFQAVLYARLELLGRVRKEGHLSQAQQDQYDRLWDMFYGETSRANQKAAAELQAAQQAHENQRQAELVSLRPADEVE